MKTMSNRTLGAAVAACALAIAPAAAFAGPNGTVLSKDIKDADGTSGQTTTTGSGVKTNHIQNGAVTSAKIAGADGTSGQSTTTGTGVKTGHIQNLAVTTAKIADGAVTAAKLAPGAVGSAAIAPGSVGTAQIADGAVTAAKIAPSSTTALPLSFLLQAPQSPQRDQETDLATKVVFPYFDMERNGANGNHGGLLVQSPQLNGLSIQGGAHIHAEIEGLPGAAQVDMYEDHAEMNLRSPNTASNIDLTSYDTQASIEITSWPAAAGLEASATQGAALLLTSPNGTRWIITVSDAGVLSVTPQ
jgi:hypothetical protein